MKINFSLKQFIVPNFAKRISFMLPAVLLMGVFVSILVEVGWGTDPASFMNLNISHVIGLSLGPTEVITYGIMFIFVLIFGAQMIGFGTLANMILIGFVIDFCRWLWANIGLADFIANGGITIKLIFFVVALLLFVIVAAIYMNAQMGVAPYDALPAIIGNALPKIPYFIVRQLFDFSAVGIGVLFGILFSKDGIQGSVIGSVVMSVLLGPVVQLVAKPLKKIL
ncbi:MAG: hypothetical protein SPH83_12255 [Treponema sp.]|nr:hypothetical protein [Spirochaetales bacterium]MDY6191245.1 hypothetical protein [Treponema sp.]